MTYHYYSHLDGETDLGRTVRLQKQVDDSVAFRAERRAKINRLEAWLTGACLAIMLGVPTIGGLLVWFL